MSCCVTGFRNFKTNSSVSLQSIDVVVKIKGFIADVESTLSYRNTETNPIEAVYEFPLDDQSAVYRFEATIEGRTIIAECQEKKQAKETYDDAMRHGYSAALMEEDDSCSDIFRCLVGNLPPNTEAVIKFAYVTELDFQPDGKLRFVLPTLLNPRYNPSSADGGSRNTLNAAMSVASSSNQTLPYSFSFKAIIIGSKKIANVTSLKDELSVNFNDARNEATITLSKQFIADHDLTLEISYDEPCKPQVIIERGHLNKEGILKYDVVMLNFIPDLSEADYSNKHEFIFVIDRSGSMQGPRIVDAKETLLLFLKSLPSGCFFNIIGFGSRFEVLFQNGSREYSEATLKEACDYQETLAANLGGTAILQPLQNIYSNPSMAGYSRQILLLTDGEVENTQDVIEIVKRNCSNTRVFAFGIGEGASTSLIKGVARAGRGKAEFVKTNERMQSKVMTILKAAMQSSVTDLHLDWQLDGSPKMTQVPRTIPPIFAGDRCIMFAIFPESSISNGTVHLKGKVNERNLEFSLDLDSTKTGEILDDVVSIHRLAAKAEIKQLQDTNENDQNKAAIVLLSTAANIISHHTSMVGIDRDRPESVIGNMIQRRVPRREPRMFMQSQPLMNCRAACRIATFSSKRCSSGLILTSELSHRASSKKCSTRSILDDCMSSRELSPPFSSRSLNHYSAMNFTRGAVPVVQIPAGSQSTNQIGYMAIVSLQTFCGSWILNNELTSVLNTTNNVIRQSMSIQDEDVWATVLAIACLQKRFADKRDEWEMIEVKAVKWLKTQNLEGHTFEELLQEAKSVISNIVF